MFQVRQAAASSLARIGAEKPYLVLSEWHSALSRERRRMVRETPSTARRRNSATVNVTSNSVMMVEALEIIMDSVTTSNNLDAGDVRHR